MRIYRQCRGLRILDVSLATGICEPALSLGERGYRRFSKDEQERIAKALGCDVGMIFPTDGDEDGKSY